MTSPDPVPLGKYRGFDLELSFDTFEKAYQVKIKGSLSRSVSLGTDAVGNITRIDNAIEKIPERLEAKSRELSTLEQQFATAKAEVEKPFDKEEELTEKQIGSMSLMVCLMWISEKMSWWTVRRTRATAYPLQRKEPTSANSFAVWEKSHTAFT